MHQDPVYGMVIRSPLIVAVPDSVIGHGVGTLGPVAVAASDQFPVLADVSVAWAVPAT